MRGMTRCGRSGLHTAIERRDEAQNHPNIKTDLRRVPRTRMPSYLSHIWTLIRVFRITVEETLYPQLSIQLALHHA